ncbi:spoIIIJ-associated protein [Microlunatus parietis]|uniref:SpoIIIJ-associated protein n=1 Tax=Microlunatus parietis TaxID=682979 RepID=A0A7Y9I8N3_9ACTN|nr:spoIIIJ-associated protein [Microlunatus parietis]
MNDTQQIDQATVADPASDEQVRPEVDVPEVAADEEAAAPVGELDADAAEAVEAEDLDDDSDDDAEDDDSEDDDDDDSEDAGPTSRLEIEAEVAADYLEELLDIADLDGDLDTFVDGDRAHVSILTDTDVLVGSNGEVLDSLQELARLAVLTETGDRSRLMLDIAGYRERRRKELTDLASDAVTEVKESSERVALAAMNAFERKIVHDVVAAAGLVSESEGEEPNRRVVVLPST